MSFELPKLNYAKSALAPIMSEETLDLHHGKHHQTYITNLNNFIKDTDMSKMTLEEIIINSSKDKSKVGIFNNASQHWNHLLFWKCMKPSGGGAMPTKLKEKIVNDFGSVEEFKKQFIQAGVTQFGSGWSWLSIDNGKLVVTKTPNAEIIKIGNSALQGAIMLLLNVNLRTKFDNLVKSIKHIELETDDNFFEHFVEGCQFKELTIM